MTLILSAATGRTVAHVSAIMDPLIAIPREGEALSAALRVNKPWAERELLVAYRGYVARVLCRVLGARADMDDLIQDVFVRALECAHRLTDTDGLGPWLGAIAVFVAREEIRRRKRRAWLFFLPVEELPEAEAHSASPETSRAMKAAYDVIATLDPDEQVVFALRHFDGRTLEEVSALAKCSLATVKRRLTRAERVFFERANADAWLSSWMEEGR